MKKLFVILLAALLLTVSGCGLLNKASSGTQASELDGTSSVGTAQQSGTPSTAAPSSDAATQSGAQSAPESSTVTASSTAPSSAPTPSAEASGDAQTVIENTVGLSIDKNSYDKGERIEVSLDFGKLNKENAVIAIVSSDAPHGNETAVHEESAREEYRWLADFSELPFFLWAPEKDGTFDVRVYADGDGGKELAFVSFVIGTAVLPQSQVTSTLSQASQATSEASGEMPVESEAQSDPNSAQSSENSRWFTDEVLSEMKLTGFTLPEGFVVLTDEELPDNMENDPYFRAIKGSPDMDGYHPLIQNAWNILKTNYGEVYTWNYYPDDLPSYKWESVMHYGGDPFFVWQEELIRSVAFTFSGTWGSGVEGTVLQIRLQPDADDPRNDYNWQ